MKRFLYILAFLFSAGIVITSCSKSSTDPDDKDNPSGKNKILPYFEYAIGTDKAIKVDCEIPFEAEAGYTITAIYAMSASTNGIFSFSFPTLSSTVDEMSPGLYPLKRFIGITYYKEAFHLSVKVPKTSGGLDYYISLDPTPDVHKNEVTKIEKGPVENGKQVYWINGQYNLPAINANSEKALITGSYRFKILTLL